MKRRISKTQWAAIVLIGLSLTWIYGSAFAGRGGGPHGGGNPGGGGGPHGGGGFNPGGSAGFHPGGGNLGAGGAGIQHTGNAGNNAFHAPGNFGGGNFNPSNFNRPTQGHVPSFSLPGQGNIGGQTFSHQGGNTGFHPPTNINNNISGQTLHVPTNNNISGQTLHKPTNNLPNNNNFIPGQTLNRPNLGNRPTNIGNHTNNFFPNNNFNNNNFIHGGNTNNVVVNKPVIGGNTNFNNFNNHHINNQNFNHNFNNFNGNNFNNFNHQNSWYHGHWHNNWNNAWYNRPTTWWGGGYGLGYGNVGFGYGGLGYGYGGYGLASIPWTWGYYNYYNPYYSQPVGGYAGFDYSQPIVAAQMPATPVVNNVVVNDPNQNPNPQPDTNDAASQALAQARASFMRGDYPAALAQTDQAVAQLPNDPVVHEFRGLVLFAMQRYKEAAAAEYGVLSLGPGWDWTTLISLYPDSDTYTGQLRALEDYTSAHPREAEARFLLAYQYLTCGHMEDAASQLKAAVELNPKDQLSAQLLASLTAPQNQGQPGDNPAAQVAQGQPAPEQAAPPTQPVDPATLVGNWQATRPDGSSFSLNLANDNTFTWKFTQQGKTQSFNGPYTLENNALILKQGDQPAMAGVITPQGNNRFNFKVGDNPADPGLTFTR